MTGFFNKFILVSLLALLSYSPVTAQEDIIFQVTSDTVAVGDTVCLSIHVGNFNSIVGMQININWDDANLQFVSSSNYGIPTFTAANCPLAFGGFRIAVNWEDITGQGVTVPDGTVLMDICFIALQAGTKPIVECNGAGMPPSVPVAIENAQGQNVYNPQTSYPGMVCIAELVTATENTKLPVIAIFPNPFYSGLNVENIQAPAVLELFQVDGNLVFTQKLNSSGQYVLLPDLPSGYYFAQLSKDGQIIGRWKMAHPGK